MSKYFFLIFLSIILVYSLSEKEKNIPEADDPGYNELLKWGIANNLTISPKIKFVKNKDRKQYMAKNLIPEEEVIMDIPPECTINVDKILNLLNSKKFRKAYNDYTNEDKNEPQVIYDENHVDRTFISYVFYSMNKRKKFYEKNKNKFYEFIKPMHYMFEDNMDHLPFYFSTDQMRFFLNTSFGSIFEIINKYINDAMALFEKKIFKKTINFEEFLPFWITVMQKSYEIDKKINIIPFIDYFRKDFKNINCEFKQENGHIQIKASQNIFPGEEIVMKVVTPSNQHRFVFFGETFDEILNEFQTFNIPSLINNYVTDKTNVNFDVLSFGEKARVDLKDKNFYDHILDIYKIFARTINEDDSDVNALKLMKKYLTRIRGNFDYIKNIDIRNAFFNSKDVNNVKRIIEGEKNFLDEKINELTEHIKDVENKRESDLKAEDVQDL